MTPIRWLRRGAGACGVLAFCAIQGCGRPVASGPVAKARASGVWHLDVWRNGPAPADSRGFQCLPGDFDGDGKSDIACYTHSGGLWHVALSTGSGWAGGTWSNGPAPGLPAAWQCVSGDFNGDKRTDIACYTGSGGNWHVALSTGSGFSASSLSGPAPGNPGGAQCLSGDFNGDGRSDIACYTGATGQWHLALSSGSTWVAPSWGGGPAPLQPISDQCVSGDFNGDHLTDIACYTGAASKWNLGLSTGAGWTSASLLGPDSRHVAEECVSADFNGDGRADIACYQPGERAWRLALSNEKGWTNPVWPNGPEWPSVSPLPQTQSNGTCLPGDFDGNTRGDIACVRRGLSDWSMGLTNGSS
jgi:hypothetical protein